MVVGASDGAGVGCGASSRFGASRPRRRLEAPRDGILDVSLRLLYDPEAPGIPAQMASQSRKLDPLEQLSLQLAE